MIRSLGTLIHYVQPWIYEETSLRLYLGDREENLYYTHIIRTLATNKYELHLLSNEPILVAQLKF